MKTHTGITIGRKNMSTNRYEEKFITNEKGKRVGVIIDIKNYNKLIEDLEELDCIRAYDKAKTSGSEAVPFDQAVREIEKSRS